MLDFSQITTQIRSFAGDRVNLLAQYEIALQEAGARLHDAEPVWDQTGRRIAESRTSWLVADWYEPPNRTVPLPERPLPHTVLAADGSQIVADRHDIALCYVLNIGMIALRYGTGERAALNSRPTLALPDDELLDTGEGEHDTIAPRRLALRRQLAEFAALSELIETEAGASGQSDDSGPGESADRGANPTEFAVRPPMIALYDGSLILWPLETEQEEYRSAVLQEFSKHLEKGRVRRTPIIGYISRPQSRDVINALRIHRCPYPQANCDRHCPNQARPRPHYVAPDCAGIEHVTDADLFERILRSGQRSALFGSRSQILNQYPEADRIRFFYLNTGNEIARIEIPAWVATDPLLLDRTHTLCFDQSLKGDGYPITLAEAHELAIVRASERDAFFRLMERELIVTRQPVELTRKAVSKRARHI